MSIVSGDPIKAKVAELDIQFTARGRDWRVQAWSYNDGNKPFLSVTSIPEGSEFEGDDINSQPDAVAQIIELRLVIEGLEQPCFISNGTTVVATEIHPDIPLPRDL